MKTFAWLCCLFFSYSLFAESIAPAGCQPLPLSGESAILKAKKPKLIFIHNTSSENLWITHPVVEPSASAGWNSQLQAGNWSALVVNKGPFALNCIESRPGHEQQVPCEGVMALCQWKQVKFPKESKTTFWAGENKTVPALKTALGERGFVLKNAPNLAR